LWDWECRKKIRQARKAYVRWRGEREEKERYIVLRKELRELSRRKEKRWTEKIEEEIRNVQTEAQM